MDERGGVARDLAATNQAEGRLAERVRALEGEVGRLRTALERALVRHVAALGHPFDYYTCTCGARADRRAALQHQGECPLAPAVDKSGPAERFS